MGGGMARGLLASGFQPSLITLSNPSSGKLGPFADAGCGVTTSNSEAVEGQDIVFVCVKPWKVEEVLAEIRPSLEKNCVVGVVAASVSRAQIASWLPEKRSYIVIPNTGINVNKSMTLITDVNSDDESRTMLTGVLDLLGEVMELSEVQLPAATAVASCGIAYLMRFVRAAEQAGVQMGLRPAEARKLAAGAMAGAGALLLQPSAHPETEIDKVTTPGGLTIRGLNTLDAEGFSGAVIKAFLASGQ